MNAVISHLHVGNWSTKQLVFKCFALGMSAYYSGIQSINTVASSEQGISRTGTSIDL